MIAAYFSNFRRTGHGTYTRKFGNLRYVSWGVQKGALNTFFLSFDIFSALASIFHLTTVSLERWLAITRPFAYKTLSTVPYSLMICGVWLTAFAIVAVRPALDKTTSNNPHRIYTPFLLLVGYVGPDILISVVNYSIFKVHGSCTHCQPSNMHGSRLGRKYRNSQEYKQTKNYCPYARISHRNVPSFLVSVLCNQHHIGFLHRRNVCLSMKWLISSSLQSGCSIVTALWIQWCMPPVMMKWEKRLSVFLDHGGVF